MKKNKITLEDKKLMRRYLIWCYKTTKEELDRIDRYFTQHVVDENILNLLLKDSKIKDKKEWRPYLEKISEFELYMENKQSKALLKKYADPDKKILHQDYLYLTNRLKAIQKTICAFLGKAALERIESMYEKEMIRRIIEAREHN